jgi:hypothetical protein
VTRNDGDPMGGLNSPLRVTHPPRERRHTAALRDSFGASNSPLPHRWLTPLPRRAAIGGGSTREMTYPPNDLFARFGTTPLTSKAPDRPDFHRGLGFDRRFARERREITAGLRQARTLPRSSSFGRRSLAADIGPYMTSGPDPPSVIYGDPFTPWLCQTRTRRGRS